MSFPRAGELWFRYDPDIGDDKYVVILDIKGTTVFAEYISNMSDVGTFYPTFCRTVSDFRAIFTKKDSSWV